EIRGVRVDNFPQDGSPAKTAGIQQGDVIIAVDGQPVEYVAQLQQLVGFRKPGDVVKVEVARKGGVRKTYNVHLIAASEPRETKKGTDGREDNHEDSEKGTNLERIGLTVIPLTQQMITEWELPAGSHGLVVQEVDPYGPADGVLSGADSRSPDIIIAAEGRPVRNEADLRTAIREAGRNGVLSLTIMNPSDSHRTRVVRVQLEDK